MIPSWDVTNAKTARLRARAHANFSHLEGASWMRRHQRLAPYTNHRQRQLVVGAIPLIVAVFEGSNASPENVALSIPHVLFIYGESDLSHPPTKSLVRMIYQGGRIRQ